jgi:hypothetical protein
VCYLRIVAFAEYVRFSTDDEISLTEAVSKTNDPKGCVDERDIRIKLEKDW